MADTIRDVVIRIAVANGDMSGFNMDSVSSAVKALRDDVQSIAKAMQDDLLAAFKNVQAGWAGGASPSGSNGTSPQPSQSPGPLGWGAGVSPPAATWNLSGSDNHPGIGSPGYNQSVRDRADDKLNAAKPELREAMEGVKDAAGNGLSADEVEANINATIESVRKKTEAIIREQDREEANGKRAYESQEAAAERAYDAEVALAVRSYSKIMKERKAAADKIEAAKQHVSDNDVANKVKDTNDGQKKGADAAKEAEKSVNAVSAANDAYVNSARAATTNALEFAKGLAFLAASGDKNDDTMMRNLVTAQGYFNLLRGGVNTLHAFGNAMRVRQNAGGGTENAGGGSGTGGSNTAASAASAFASAATNPYMLLALVVGGTALIIREHNMFLTEENKKRDSLNTNIATINSEYADKSVERHAEQSIRLSNSMPNIGQINQQQISQAGRDATETAIQKEQGSSTRDFQGVQEIRARREREQGLTEHRQEARNNLTHVESQQAAMSGAKQKLERDKLKSHHAFNERLNRTKNEFRKKKGVERVVGGLLGTESDDSVEAHNEGVKLKLKEAQAQRAAEMVQQQAASLSIDQQSLVLGQKRVDAASQILNATREQVAAARQNYENDKQTVAAGKQRFGAMSFGDQLKIRSIESKRKSGQKLEKWERDQVRGLHGTKLADAAREQDEKEGDGLESSVDVKASKVTFDKAKESQGQGKDELQSVVNSQSAKNATLAEDIKNAIKESFNLEEFAATMIAQFNEQKIKTEDLIRRLKNWFK